MAHSGIGCRTNHHDGDSRHTPRSGTRCAVRMSESHAGTSCDILIWVAGVKPALVFDYCTSPGKSNTGGQHDNIVSFADFLILNRQVKVKKDILGTKVTKTL